MVPSPENRIEIVGGDGQGLHSLVPGCQPDLISHALSSLQEACWSSRCFGNTPVKLLWWGLCPCCFLCVECFPPDIKYLTPLLPWGPCYPVRDVFPDTKSKLALPHHSSIPVPFFTLFIAPVNTRCCVTERLTCVAILSCLCIEAHCHTLLAQYRCTSYLCWIHEWWSPTLLFCLFLGGK